MTSYVRHSFPAVEQNHNHKAPWSFIVDASGRVSENIQDCVLIEYVGGGGLMVHVWQCMLTVVPLSVWLSKAERYSELSAIS